MPTGRPRPHRLAAVWVAAALLLFTFVEWVVCARWGTGTFHLLFTVPPSWPHQPWTLLTSVLAHGSWTHTLANAAAIAVVGGLVERRVSRRTWWLLFLGVGSVAGVLQAKLGHTPTLGASGAALAFLGTWFWTGVDEVPYYRDEPPQVQLAFSVLVSLALLGALAWDWWSRGPGGGRVAHQVGLAAGVIVGVVWTLRGGRRTDEKVPAV